MRDPRDTLHDSRALLDTYTPPVWPRRKLPTPPAVKEAPRFPDSSPQEWPERLGPDLEQAIRQSHSGVAHCMVCLLLAELDVVRARADELEREQHVLRNRVMALEAGREAVAR